MTRKQFIKGSAIVGLGLASTPVLKAGSGMLNSKSYRKVYRVLSASKQMVGTLPVLRAFAGDHTDYVSPYVFFDEFGPVNLKPQTKPLRVDAHPHAGIIPTTYFISGSGHHKDSLNYDFQIGVGEFMMFHSGKGAIHMEETGKKLYDEGGDYHGFQIWLNQPARLKHTAPETYVHKDEKTPTIVNKDYTAKVVLGEMFGVKSKIEMQFNAFYVHLKMNAGCRLDIPVEATHNAFVYIIKGKVETEGSREVKANQVVLYQRGENLINLFSAEGAELLLLGGQPLNEPLYSYGPFVMNTEAEIQQCIMDYNSGKMGNPAEVNR